MIGLKLLLLGLFLKATIAPQLTATLSEPKVRPDTDFELSISVKTEEEVEASPPQWSVPNGLQNLGMQTRSSFESRLLPGPNGMQFEKKRTIEFIYQLRSIKEGNYKLGPFIVPVGGQNLTLGAVELIVSKKAPAPSLHQQLPGGGLGGGLLPPGFEEDEEDSLFGQLLRRQPRTAEPKIPERKLPINEKEAFFVILETDKKEAFEGEQVFASWYVYTRGNIHQFDRLKFPSLKGFWKEDVEPAPNLNFEKEMVNGVLFHRALLASYALFPIKAGTSVIDEYKIKASVSLPSPNMGIFGQLGFGQAYTYTRTSVPLKILVKPLPEENRPQSFSGAVGNFKIEAHVESQNFVQGQPFTLKLRFEGDGNAKLIELPKLVWPTGFELYDTKSESKYFQSGKSYKEFVMLVIPKESGVLKLPPFEFSYFEPSSATYKTIQTQEIALQVAPGTMQPKLSSARMKLDDKPKEVTYRLPAPETKSMVRSWQWLSGWDLFYVWTGLYSVLFLIFILGHWIWLKKLSYTKNLMDDLRERKHKCDKIISAEKFSLAAAEVINATYFLLSRLVDQDELNRDLSNLLEHLPPSVRAEISTPLMKELEILQTIAFAPGEAWSAISNIKELRTHTDLTFQILEQTLRLAEEGS